MKRIWAAAVAVMIAASLTGCSEKETETMHPNEELARDAYEAFRNKDIPAVMQLMTDGIVFEIPGKSIQSGTFKGKSEVGRYFTIIGKHTAGTHTLEVLDVFADDTQVIALLRALGQHEEKVFDMTVVHLLKVSNGKASEVRIIPTDQYAFDEFWS